MLDLNKLSTKVRMEIILVWLETLGDKPTLSWYDESIIKIISDFLLKEVSK